MLRFELKKIYKSNILLIILLFSISISWFVVNRTKNTPIEQEYDSISKKYSNLLALNLNTEITGLHDTNKNNEDKELSKEFYDILEMSGSHLDIIYFDRFKDMDYKELNERIKTGEIESYNLINNLNDLIHKYNKELSPLQRSDLEWTLKEYKYSIENDVRIKSTMVSNLSTNYTRILVYNSYYILGLPIFLVLILLFHGIMNDERQQGNITLLRTSRYNDKEIIKAKTMTIFIVGILYLILVFIMLAAISSLYGYQLTGFNEIYRILNRYNNTKSILGYQMIFYVVLAYISLLIMFSSLIVLISNFVRKNETSLILLLAIIVLFSVFTINVNKLQNIFNPLYAMDYYRNILGTYNNVYLERGQNVDYASNISYYSLYILLAILFYFANMLVFHEYKSKSRIFKRGEANLLSFEIRKIVGNSSIYLASFAILLVIFSIFINEKISDERIIGLNTGSGAIIESARQEFEKISKIYEEDKSYVLIYESTKATLENAENISESYLNKDGEVFYRNTKEYIDHKMLEPSPSYKAGRTSNATQLENTFIFEYAESNDINPVYINHYFISDYEEFSNESERNTLIANERYYSNSTVFSIYKIFNKYNFDIIILFIVITVIAHGLVYDKNSGSQIDFMYTQAISRRKIYISKILSSFIVSISFLSGIILFISILGFITDGIGELRFPIIEYTKLIDNPVGISKVLFRESINIISLFNYILRIVFILSLQILFLISLQVLLSLFVKKKNLLMFLSGITISLGILVSQIIPSSFKHLSPFVLLKSTQIANGSIKIHADISNQSLINSITILIICSVILMILGVFIVEKKEL